MDTIHAKSMSVDTATFMPKACLLTLPLGLAMTRICAPTTPSSTVARLCSTKIDQSHVLPVANFVDATEGRHGLDLSQLMWQRDSMDWTAGRTWHLLIVFEQSVATEELVVVAAQMRVIASPSGLKNAAPLSHQFEQKAKQFEQITMSKVSKWAKYLLFEQV